MKLIVGLGNPGKEYENTRHNMGFMAIDFYAQKNNLDFKKKFNGLYSETTINGEKIILLKPQTYMNLSGNCIIEFVNYFKIDLDDVLIIYDDKDFDLGTFKIKKNGSSGGHNGMNNIISHFKTQNIKRIRMGISKNDIPLIDYVLQKMGKNEMDKINGIFPIISDVIEDFVKLDFEALMSKYNGENNEW